MDPLATIVRELTSTAVIALCGNWPAAQTNNVNTIFLPIKKFLIAVSVFSSSGLMQETWTSRKGCVFIV